VRTEVGTRDESEDDKGGHVSLRSQASTPSTCDLRFGFSEESLLGERLALLWNVTANETDNATRKIMPGATGERFDLGSADQH
jgi:hypothetical protein